MRRYLLLGTAGHIDHGKTSLIQALTGVDTDRLPEEKRRGITVDLGFAALELDDLLLGIVDVPGHERFIKNMLAGATGIDLALLVVAADEGVMPQTREHFEALRYLSLSAGVTAITKCDLVDDEMLTLVEEEISQLVTDTFLQNSPVVPVSSKTGSGLAELRAALSAVAQQIPVQNTEGPFKLTIDRCFSAPGQGTVVTGSVVSGCIVCGDQLQLQLLPQDSLVTVRGIESHGQRLETIGRGQRAAVNLSRVHFRDVTRGNLLVTAGSVVPSRRLSVLIEASRYLSRPLKSRTDVRFHYGTLESAGLLRLLESNSLSAGDSQIGQIELRENIGTNWGEPFVVRGLAANEIVGGGQVIDPCAPRVLPNDTMRVNLTRGLLEGDGPTRVASVIALHGARLWTPDELTQRAGVANYSEALCQLVEIGVLCRFDLKGGTRWLHHDVVRQLEARLKRSLEQEHKQDALKDVLSINRISKYFASLEPPELLVHLAKRLSAAGQLRVDGDNVALADWKPILTPNQSVQLEEVLIACQDAGLTPPSVGELAARLAISVDEAESLMAVGVRANQLIRLPDKDPRDAKAAQRTRLYLHRKMEKLLFERLSTQLADFSEWTISQFSEKLGLSRKYAIPLCNHLDQAGITERQGDLRKLVAPDSTIL